MSNYRYAYGAGAAPPSRPPLGLGQASRYSRHVDSDEDEVPDLLDRNRHIDYDPASPPRPAHAWQHENGLDPSDSDREDSGDEVDYQEPNWASDSDQEEGNDSQDFDQDDQLRDLADEDDQIPPLEDEDEQHPANPYRLDNDRVGHRYRRFRQDSDDAASIEDADHEHSDSSRTVSDSEGNNPTPSPSPSLHYDSDNSGYRRARQCSAISDSEAEAESEASFDAASPQSLAAGAGSSASASVAGPATSSSQGSRRDPQSRAPVRGRRLSGQSDFDFEEDDNNSLNGRPSPRLSSLTPVYHPNRRLPRQSPATALGRNPSRPPADETDSDDEPIIQQHVPRRLGIERTRRPRPSNHARIVIDYSDEELESGDELFHRLPTAVPNEQAPRAPPGLQQAVEIPDEVSDVPDYNSIENYSDPDSDYGDHAIHPYEVQDEDERSDFPSEESSSVSSSSEEEGSSDNELSQSEGSQSGEERDGVQHLQNQLPDHVVAGQAAQARARYEQAQRREAFFRQLAQQEQPGNELLQSDGSQSGEEHELVHIESDNEDEVESPRLHRQREQSGSRFLRQQQAVADLRLGTAARRAAAARAARNSGNPAQQDSDSGEDIMDVDDELVEVVFDNYNQRQRHQQRQNNHRQNSQARNNQGRPIDIIDLTEEPDSPVMDQHAPINEADANQAQHYLNAMLGRHGEQRPFRQPHRMAQNGRRPSLANPGPGRATVIDLTLDDEPEDAADEDDDGLFVRQNNDHIPANRRLPPIPAPQRRNNRPRVEIFDLARAGEIGGNLRNYIGRRFGNLFGPINGLPEDLLDGNYFAAAAAMNPNVDPNPLAGNPPDFNYQANGWAAPGGERPKPQFEEPPPARPGFTRNTGPDPETGEEQTFICASCDNELKYYDDEVVEPPAKRAKKGKKAREEHHFWAVKACGHVSTFLVNFELPQKPQSCLLTSITFVGLLQELLRQPPQGRGPGRPVPEDGLPRRARRKQQERGQAADLLRG